MIVFAGEYLVSVKFNDQHIPDSPFKVQVAPAAGETRKLTIENLEEQSLSVCFIYSSAFGNL